MLKRKRHDMAMKSMRKSLRTRCMRRKRTLQGSSLIHLPTDL